MKIAVTYENGQVFQHFGHAEQFKVYTVENGKVVSSEIISTNGSGHSALAELLSSLAVNALICGGIGGGAKTMLADAGIELYAGVTGDADSAVADFLRGRLNYNPDTTCSHHEAHGECGEHDHKCGNH